MESFQIIYPSSLLTPYVKQYWFLSVDNIERGIQRMIPSGSAYLVFNRGQTIYSSGNDCMSFGGYLAGQRTAFIDIYFGKLDLIMVIFQPIAARIFFNIPIDELEEKNIEISLLGDSLLKELNERLKNEYNNIECIHLIEQFFFKRLHLFNDYNYKRLATAIQDFQKGESDIPRLADSTCLGYKQFKRIFAEYAGINPKSFIQINRFSKALYYLQSQPLLSLNDLAYKCGYYDKSHLIKDIKQYSGYTPREFLQISDPYSEYKSLFQTFFVELKQ
ncbi:MAG: helix-turn-helix domain-containing protein [Dysgonomonas sp.]|nr:helix-turn-helix domain-containing protein [Dysgonomonas sp.]